MISSPPLPGTDYCYGNPCVWPASREGIEYKAVSVVEKLTNELAKYVFHSFWNDGKNPGCMKSCSHLSNWSCYGEAGLAVMACIAASPATCSVNLVTAGVGAIGTIVGSECVDVMRTYCSENICTR